MKGSLQLKQPSSDLIMGIFKKIENFVNKTYTDKKTGEGFLTLVLALGIVGALFCLVRFALLLMRGMPLWVLIFDITIILFCAWAIIKGVIPMAKDAFNHLDKLDEK